MDNKLNQVSNQTSLHFQNNPTSGYSLKNNNNNNNNTNQVNHLSDYKFPGQDHLDELEQRLYNFNKPF